MKISAGIYKNRILKTPKGKHIRPTSSKVRESLFNILQHQVEGSHVLDVFAGSGSIGIEAISRGAAAVEFIEVDRISASCIRENLETLGIDAKVYQQSANQALELLLKRKSKFDIIYVDPPYDLDITCLLEKVALLLASSGILIVEQRKNNSLSILSLSKVDERNFGDTTLHFFQN